MTLPGEVLQVVAVVGRRGHQVVHRDLTEARFEAKCGLSGHGPEVAGVWWRLCVLSSSDVAMTSQVFVTPRLAYARALLGRRQRFGHRLCSFYLIRGSHLGGKCAIPHSTKRLDS